MATGRLPSALAASPGRTTWCRYPPTSSAGSQSRPTRLEKTEPGPTQTTTVRTYPCGLTARYGSNGRILIWSAPAKRSGDLNIIRIFRAKDCVVQPQGLGRRNRIYAGTDGRNTSVVVSCHGTGAATPLGL